MKRPRLIFLLPLLVSPLLAFAVGGSPTAEPPSSATETSSVEVRRLQAALQQERSRLEADYLRREQELMQREISLKTLQEEVDKKLSEMKSLRQEVDLLLSRKSEVEEKRVKELGRMYEKMESAQAAALLEGLDRELAVAILGGMKAKAAGKVLDNMDRQKASRLSASYSTLAPD